LSRAIDCLRADNVLVLADPLLRYVVGARAGMSPREFHESWWMPRERDFNEDRLQRVSHREQWYPVLTVAVEIAITGRDPREREADPLWMLEIHRQDSLAGLLPENAERAYSTSREALRSSAGKAPSMTAFVASETRKKNRWVRRLPGGQGLSVNEHLVRAAVTDRLERAPLDRPVARFGGASGFDAMSYRCKSNAVLAEGDIRDYVRKSLFLRRIDIDGKRKYVGPDYSPVPQKSGTAAIDRSPPSSPTPGEEMVREDRLRRLIRWLRKQGRNRRERRAARAGARHALGQASEFPEYGKVSVRKLLADEPGLSRSAIGRWSREAAARLSAE